MNKDGRSLALSVLNRLDQKKLTLDVILDDLFREHKDIPRREKALANIIVFGVLRWRGRLDFIIDRFASRGIGKIDHKVLNVLRMGLFQVMYLDRVPESAAVNTSVDLAADFGGRPVSGFVNGMLRNIIRSMDDIKFPDADKNPAYAVSIEKSFPQWLINKWIERFGIDETRELCDAVNSIPPITVRTNTLKTDRAKLMDSLAGDAENLSKTPFSELGISFEKPVKSLSELKAFEEGLFQVQDEAAQLVAELLDPSPNESVLDACAGLGGKTGHLAQLMENRGSILAVDSDQRKLESLMKEMNRLGVSVVETSQMDLTRKLDSDALPMFDKILLDAPCTGSGVIRRNPDAKWSLSGKDVKSFGTKQLRLLNNLSAFLKDGGVITYAVCSTELEENESVIRRFLEKHKDFYVDRSLGSLGDSCAPLFTEEGFLKTYPHKSDMDGFFAARLVRKSS